MLIEKTSIMDQQGVELAIRRICFEIIERNRGVKNTCLLGVFTRGAVLARRMAEVIDKLEGGSIEVGSLDITPFRDDRKGENGVDRSQVDFDLSGKKVILVDDVLHTGRTVRAAIDAIMSRGRPQSIQLAVLIDRGQRELPIRADYIGRNVPTAKAEAIKLRLIPQDDCDKVVICDVRD